MTNAVLIDIVPMWSEHTFLKGKVSSNVLCLYEYDFFSTNILRTDNMSIELIHRVMNLYILGFSQKTDDLLWK